MSTPFYVLAATPTTTTRLRDFSREGSDSPGSVLTHPPVIRRAGFDTSTGEVAQLVAGERWEVQSGDRKLLRLYQDGTLLFRMRADGEFLAWALGSRHHYGHPTLNAVAVVESHLSFVHLAASVLPWFKERPKAIKFTLRFKDAQLRNQPLALMNYVDSSRQWILGPDIHPIHKPDAETSIEIRIASIAESPDTVAYDLLVRFYNLFDAPEDMIPFTKVGQNGKSIDTEALEKL